jgi:tetratricopeptide (TPR) repeat protein
VTEGESSTWWALREGALLHRDARPSIPVWRETPLRGRERELGTLREHWGEARDGRGRCLLLEGEPGIGKTRLLADLVAEVVGGPAHVLYGAYLPVGGRGGLSEAILERFGRRELAEKLRPYLDETPRLVDDYAALVRNEGPVPGSERVQGAALQALTCHLMRGLSRERPLLWIVDDLHFAEPDSWQIAAAMARALEGYRILLVLVTEPGAPEARRLTRLEGVESLALSRLPLGIVTELVRDVLRAPERGERLAPRIAARADGVPYFALEIARGLREAEAQGEAAWQEDDSAETVLPAAVRDLVADRLEGFSRTEREILDVGAVLGLEIDSDLVARVLERRRVAVLQDLAEIERRTGVVRSQDGRLRFDHQLLREMLYDDLPEELRAEYHALVADAFAEREETADRDPGTLPGDALTFLAHHHLRGSRPSAVRPYLKPALEHLERAYRNESALDLAGRALAEEGLLEGIGRIRVLLVRVGRLALLGRREEERSDLEEALRLAEEIGDVEWIVHVLRRLGAHYWAVSRPAEAETWLARALEKAREHGLRREEGHTCGNLGNARENLGRYAEARADYERAIAIAREFEDERSESTTTGNLGLVLLNLGMVDEAERLLRRQSEIAGRRGDRQGEAAANGNLAIIELRRGRPERARELTEASLLASREIGDRASEGVATTNLGELARHLGRTGEALALAERARVLSREVGDRVGEAVALLNDGALRSFLGDRDAAEDSFERAGDILQSVGARREETYAHYGRAEAADRAGDLERAETLHREALAARRDLAYPGGTADSLEALGRILLRTGREGEAIPLLEEAVEIASRVEAPGALARARAALAFRSEEDAAAARELLETSGANLSLEERLECRAALWRATGSSDDLGRARRHLRTLVAGAPPDRRDAVRAAYAAIREAPEP